MQDKIRVNVTVDRNLLKKAKTKLDLFGGKLSTLFNAYLRDFVFSIEKDYNTNYKQLNEKIKELDDKLTKIEKKLDF